MPEELGVARRDELMGTFPGEDVERASMLVRFLEGIGQLLPPEAEGKDTEITSRQKCTETGLTPSNGNGQSNETLFEQPVPVIETMGDDLLAPEPLNAHEIIPLALEASPEPVSLDAAPDLTSPELDNLDDDEDFTDSPDLPPLSGSLPTITPEPHEISQSMQRDTGLLEMDGTPPELDTTLNSEDLGIDPEEDEETNIKDEEEAEKITSKVSPDNRRDDPDANVRDTVNFYNQTQRMPGTRQITPDSIASSAAGTTPLGDSARHDQPAIEPDSLPEPDIASMEPMSLDAAPEPPSMDRFTDDLELSEMSAESIDEDPSEMTPVTPLPAIENERKDTQKFFVADILSDPQDSTSGDTAIDTATEIPSARRKMPEPEEVQPLPPPVSVEDFLSVDGEPLPADDASERITPELALQNDKDAQGPATDQTVRSGESTIDELSQNENTAPILQISTDTSRVTVEPDAVPSHSAATRIVSRQPEEAVADVSGEDTDSEQMLPVQDASANEASADDTDSDIGFSDDASQDVRPSSRVRRITDALTRRLRLEKDETEALIEAAEKVAQRLRDASTASRTDLEVVSSPITQHSEEDPSEAITARNHAIPEKKTGGRLGDLLSQESEPVERDEKDELRRMAAALDRRTEKIKESARKKTEHQPDSVQEQFDAAAETLRHPVVGARPTEPEPKEIIKKERVPTSAIGDLLDRIEGKLGGGAASIEELFEESQKETTSRSAIDDPYAEMDIDELVAASGRFRELIDEQLAPEDRQTAKVSAQRKDSGRKHRQDEDSLSARTAKISGTPLAKNLDNLWSEVSSRQTGVLQKDKGGRIRQREEIGIGWTQEALWLTMGAITVAAAAVASVIVFAVFQLFS